MPVLRDCLSIGETEDEKHLKMEQACRDLHSSPLGRGFNSRHLHQKFKPPKGRLLFLVNEAARLHFTLWATCRISGNRKSSSQKLRQRLACEDVSFRLRSITLVKRSACAAREVFSLARVRLVMLLQRGFAA